MWIFSKAGFFSAVEHRKEPDKVLVRARARDDLIELNKLLGRDAAAIIETPPPADYPFRVLLSKRAWARAVGKLATDIDYPNFKSEIKDPDRHNAYMKVWSVMADLGTGRRRR